MRLRTPTDDDAPTINYATVSPVFTIDEELDSLAIRYIEVAK